MFIITKKRIDKNFKKKDFLLEGSRQLVIQTVNSGRKETKKGMVSCVKESCGRPSFGLSSYTGSQQTRPTQIEVPLANFHVVKMNHATG
jgi:hypothetical protein